MNVFYRCNEPSGFHLTINEGADEALAAFVVAYTVFKQMAVAEQQKAIALFPKILTGVSNFVKIAGEPVSRGDQRILEFGARVVYVMEKEGLLPDDRYNGFEYRTMAEVNAFRAVMDSINQKKPGAFVLNYRHDDDCPKLHGGECGCIADVAVEALR